VKNPQKKDSGKKYVRNPDSVAKSAELKKKEIQSEEHSVNKEKKVKRFSTDKNLPETVRKRNIA